MRATALPRIGGLALFLSASAAAQQPIPLDTLRAGAGSRIVAGAAAATRSIEVIDRASIDALPARSVADVLARALGTDLLARSAAQADLAIRGSGFEQVLVMVDGVPVNDDQTGHFHLNLAVPLESIERIEVLRGPAAALYGSAAVGGVVNVVTRRAAGGRGGAAEPASEFAVRAQAGSFGAAVAGAEARLTRGAGFGVRASAERDRGDGHRPGTDHDITQARLALDAPFADGSLAGHVAYAARDFGAAGFYAPFDSYEETRTQTAALSWRSAPGTLTLEPRVSLRRHEDDFILRRDDPSFYRNRHTGSQAAAELVTRWMPVSALRLAAGAEAARSRLASSSLGDRVEDRTAAFAELAAGDAAASLLTLGLRLDRHSAFGAYVSPSIAAGHRTSERLLLRASAGAGFRAPSWTERYYRDPANIGDPDLDAETFRTAELGAEMRFGAGASLDAAVFVRQADGLIDWARPAGSAPSVPWRTMNVERSTFRGLETTGRANLAAVAVTARAALLGFSADVEPGLASKYALRPLTRSLGIELDAPLSGRTRLVMYGSHRRRAGDSGDGGDSGDSGDSGDEWQLVDLRLSRSVSAVRGLQIHLDATNLFDAAYHDVAGQPAPGRALLLGGRLRR
jgi:vitamin B12 transporter